MLNQLKITEEEYNKCLKWQTKHNKKHHKHQNFGAIGGQLTYQFIPTSIGVIGTCVCACGAEFDFRLL